MNLQLGASLHFYNFLIHLPLTFFGRLPRLAGSLATRAGFGGHVDVEAMEVWDEQVDECLRDCFTELGRAAVLVMKLTCSCRAIRCGEVIFLTDTFLQSANDCLWASAGRFIHSSSILEDYEIFLELSASASR